MRIPDQLPGVIRSASGASLGAGVIPGQFRLLRLDDIRDRTLYQECINECRVAFGFFGPSFDRCARYCQCVFLDRRPVQSCLFQTGGDVVAPA